MSEDSKTDIGWYVSDTHCRRAIGYLSAELAGNGYLPNDFELPKLFELWGEALSKTMDVNEPSPIGPDPEVAERILSVKLSPVEALTALNELRSNVITSQNAGWSNLVYPLVAILNAAGYEQFKSTYDQLEQHQHTYGGAGGFPGHIKNRNS